MALSGFASYLVQRKASHWPTVAGEIHRTEVVNENDYYFVQLEYEYTVGGVSFTSDDVELNSGIGGISVSSETMGGETLSQAKAIRDAYPIGKRVSVHYDPSNPQRAALRIETTGLLVIGCFGALIAAVALLPLKFPKLFQSVRQRVAGDTELRCERSQILFTQESLKELARNSAASDGDRTGDRGSILDAPQYTITNWRPGDLVDYQRSNGGLLSRSPAYQVGFDWPGQVLVVGPEGSTESIPFANIDELRVHGLHAVRRRSGGRSGGSSSYEAWDVWLDAIVGSRRIRLASREGYRDPDRAYREALRPAAQLTTTLNKSLRFVGFENHAEYRPPQTVPELNLATDCVSDLPVPTTESTAGATPVIASTGQSDAAAETWVDQPGSFDQQTALPLSKPLNSRISMELSDERIEVNLPRSRRVPDVQGVGIAVVCGGFAAMISPAVFGDPDLGPRLFVGLLWLVPLVCPTQMIRKWARTGAIEATRDGLTVMDRYCCSLCRLRFRSLAQFW